MTSNIQGKRTSWRFRIMRAESTPQWWSVQIIQAIAPRPSDCYPVARTCAIVVASAIISGGCGAALVRANEKKFGTVEGEAEGEKFGSSHPFFRMFRAEHDILAGDEPPGHSGHSGHSGRDWVVSALTSMTYGEDRYDHRRGHSGGAAVVMPPVDFNRCPLDWLNPRMEQEMRI